MNLGVHIHSCPVCREQYLCKGDRFKSCDGIDSFECEMCHIKAAYMGQTKCSDPACVSRAHAKGFCDRHYTAAYARAKRALLITGRIACLTARRAS